MTRFPRGRVLPAAGLLLTLVLAGCGDKGPKVVKVNGTVTRNGKPVPNVAVHFTPPAGRPSLGMADANGNFKLQYTVDKDGAEVGTHKVHVEFPPASPQEENDLATGKKQVSADRREILKKYGDPAKTTLEVEVKDDGSPVEVKLD